MPTVLVWCALAAAAVGHGLLWAALVNRLHAWAGPRPLIKTATLLCGVALVVIPAAIIVWLWGESVTFERLASAPLVAVYVGFCASLGAVGLALKPRHERRRYDAAVVAAYTTERRDFDRMKRAAQFVGSYSRLLGRIPGNEALSLSIDRKRLILPRLPAELEGLTIAHLSDLHMTGKIGRDYYLHVAETVNSLRPDVIAVTGDIAEHESAWPWLADALGSLCAPLGVYFILGNHDAFIDANRTRQLLMDAGLTCLSGRWLRADWNGAAVLLGGNERPWMPPAAPLEELPRRAEGKGEFRMALCHTPDQFPWCVAADVDLALAGHTHGGQVQLPWLGVIASPSWHGARYACGVFRRGNTVLHVSRGVGGETPLRWRCPPEIALLELAAAGS